MNRKEFSEQAHNQRKYVKWTQHPWKLTFLEAEDSHFIERDYPKNLIQTTLPEVKFEERKLTLQPKQRGIN